LRANFFKTIGHNDIQVNAPSSHSESITKYQRFRVCLRKLDFLNLMREKADFRSLGGEVELSDQLKRS
jgi:hypothetical protein